MKSKPLQDYKKKPATELMKELTEKKETLANLKFDLTLGKVTNIKEIRQLKKTIAQILTIINNQ